MKNIPIRDFGRGGLNTDIPQYSLPPNMVSIASNVRVSDGAIGNINCGSTTWNIAAEIPLNLRAFEDPEGNNYWVYCSADKIIIIDPVLTTLASGFIDAAYWTSDVLTGIPVFCQEAAMPQYWPVVDSGTPVIPLPWDVTDGTDWDNAYGEVYRAEVIRSHKNYLFALNIKDGANKYKHMVHWSEPAAPGDIPSTWKYREPDNRSGRRDLAETKGEVVDGLTLGDSFLVYKTDSVWRFTFIGGNSVFRSSRIQNLPGILARNCVTDVEDGSHVVLSQSDIYIHNGQTFKSLITNRTRKRFLSLIDNDNFQKCFVVKNSQYKEVWICVPVTGHGTTTPIRAGVWSWEDDTWTERDLLEINCASEGPVLSPGRTLINDAIGPLGEDHTLINQVNITPKNIALLGGSNTNVIYQYDTSGTNDGVPFLSHLQRQYIKLTEDSQQEAISRAYLEMDWYGGPAEVMIRFGSHRSMRAPVNPDKWKSFYIKEQRFVNVRTTGSFHAFEIKTENGATWGLSAMSLDVSPDGEK